MYQRIEAIGMKLLTCIYDPKTHNLHSSFHYTLLTFSLLWRWITWLPNLLTVSDLNHEKSVLKMLERQYYTVIGNKQIFGFYKDFLPHRKFLKVFKEMIFTDPGAPFFLILLECDQAGAEFGSTSKRIWRMYFLPWKYIVINVNSSRMPVQGLV